MRTNAHNRLSGLTVPAVTNLGNTHTHTHTNWHCHMVTSSHKRSHMLTHAHKCPQSTVLADCRRCVLETHCRVRSTLCARETPHLSRIVAPTTKGTDELSGGASAQLSTWPNAQNHFQTCLRSLKEAVGENMEMRFGVFVVAARCPRMFAPPTTAIVARRHARTIHTCTHDTHWVAHALCVYGCHCIHNVYSDGSLLR